MTPDQTSQLEALVAAIRDVDAQFPAALEAQNTVNTLVANLTVQSETARQAYETFMWQLKDDPDLLNPAVAAEPAPVVEAESPAEAAPAAEVPATPEPAPVEAVTPSVEGADVVPPPEPTTGGSDTTAADTTPATETPTTGV